MTLKDELPRSVGAQYATGEEQTIAQERMKRLSQSGINTRVWIRCPLVDVSDGESKV